MKRKHLIWVIPAAIINIGLMLHYGNLKLTYNYVSPEKALQMSLMEKARAGDSLSEAHLGAMYLVGKGVEQDFKKGKYWIELSAKQGNADAQNNLGYIYQQGLGVQQDYKKARYWFLRSAKQNSAGAATNLGALYINGWGGKVDLDQGKYWMMRAASQDEDQKAKTTGIKSLRLIAYLKKNDISIAQAKKISAQNMIHALCEKGEHGDVKAQVALGYYYLRGIKASANGEYVFQPNNKASIYWLEKAAGNGSYEAKTYLQSKDMKVLEDAVDQNEYKVE